MHWLSRLFFFKKRKRQFPTLQIERPRFCRKKQRVIRPKKTSVSPWINGVERRIRNSSPFLGDDSRMPMCLTIY